jgi:ornithine cyclodeaminase/alanine dehydrogenase
LYFIPGQHEANQFRQIVFTASLRARPCPARCQQQENDMLDEKTRDSYLEKLAIGNEVLYLSEQDCKDTGTTVPEIIAATEAAMAAYSKKETEMPAKIGLHPMPDSLMHAMPAYIKSAYACGIKWGSNFPTNRQHYPGVTPTNCQIIYNDASSGLPLAIMDATWITEIRTPATALVGIKYGANLKARTFGMIGCGIQGKANVKMIQYALPELETIYIYNRGPAAMDALVKECQPVVKAQIVKCSNPEELVRKSEVITSAIPIAHTPAPFVKREWVGKGKTLVCLDCHSVYEDAVYKSADRYYVDSIEQHELLKGYGYYPWGLPTITGETGALAAGLVPGRKDKDDLLIFNNVGMAVEDMLCAKIIFERALKMNLGVKLPLWKSTNGLQ